MPRKQDPKNDGSNVEEVDLSSVKAPGDGIFEIPEVLLDETIKLEKTKKSIEVEDVFGSEFPEEDEILSKAGLANPFGGDDLELDEFDEFDEFEDEED